MHKREQKQAEDKVMLNWCLIITNMPKQLYVLETTGAYETMIM